MGIGLTTVNEWMSKGWLKSGRHYIKMGRKIWFEWGPELIDKLREDSAKRCETVNDKPKTLKPMREKGKNIYKKTAINLHY